MGNVASESLGDNAGAPLIKLESVRKQYMNGAVNALDGIDLDIYPGDLVIVIGPSGSGKSTLLYQASALDVPTEGHVYFNGKDTSAMNDKEKSAIRARIGFVFQDWNLIDAMDAIENVEIGITVNERDERGKKITEKMAQKRSVAVLSEIGLESRASHTPDQLSGGEKQRVAIARAIAKNPSIIVADEPTGSLDSANGQQIIELLKGLNDKGFTVLIVTHNEALARRYAKRLVSMKDGKIASDEVIRT